MRVIVNGKRWDTGSVNDNKRCGGKMSDFIGIIDDALTIAVREEYV